MSTKAPCLIDALFDSAGIDVQHFMRIIRQHLPSSDTEGDEDRSAFEATALKEVLSSYIPSMQKINDLDTVVEQAGTVVNAAILLVRCLVPSMLPIIHRFCCF